MVLSKRHFLDTAQIFTRAPRKAPAPLKGLPLALRVASNRLKDVGDALLNRRRLANPEVDRYVFVDDVCGSGETAIYYSRDFLQELTKLNPKAELHYLAMFATKSGIRNIRDNSIFGPRALAVYELDESYRCLCDKSRYFKIMPPLVDADKLRTIAEHYGKALAPGHALGYQDSQLLLGFSHNIPDNTLPIIWRDPSNGAPREWAAAFPRYMKI